MCSLFKKKQDKNFTAIVKLNAMLKPEDKDKLIKDLNNQVKNKIVVLPCYCELQAIVNSNGEIKIQVEEPTEGGV